MGIKKTILEAIGVAIDSFPPHYLPIKTTWTVHDGNGCEYGLVTRSALDGGLVLLDLHNGPDTNPCEMPVAQLESSLLLGILRDIVNFARDLLIENQGYSPNGPKEVIARWASDASLFLTSGKTAYGMSRRQAACRYIHEVLKGGFEEFRFDFYKSDIFETLPHALVMDKFLGLTTEGVIDFEGMRLLTPEETRHLSLPEKEFEPIAIQVAGGSHVTLLSTVNRLDIFWSDPSNDDGLWLPDESVFALEAWLNRLENLKKKH